MSSNTPFNGWDVKGKAIFTLVGGKVVFDGVDLHS
jgi:dihydroorotase-like cyclic amidohydrolase